ncbi:hypothetical protein DYS67_06840, partial [Bacillus subtilis subsp. subtilis]
MPDAPLADLGVFTGFVLFPFVDEPFLFLTFLLLPVLIPAQQQPQAPPHLPPDFFDFEPEDFWFIEGFLVRFELLEVEFFVLAFEAFCLPLLPLDLPPSNPPISRFPSFSAMPFIIFSKNSPTFSIILSGLNFSNFLAIFETMLSTNFSALLAILSGFRKLNFSEILSTIFVTKSSALVIMASGLNLLATSSTFFIKESVNLSSSLKMVSGLNLLTTSSTFF